MTALPLLVKRTCSVCGESKPETGEFFNSQRHGARGLTAQCRECHKARMRKRNPIHYAKNREREMIRQYKAADIKSNRQTDITADWMRDNITSKPCFYCETTDAPRGCDRLDNDLGHVTTNVVPCCKLCNKTRNNHFSVDEMKRIGAVIKSIRESRRARL